jgi:hypothetical protein
MKVYKVYWHTVDMGGQLSWHATKRDAEHDLAEAIAIREAGGEGVGGPEGIDVEDIPTDKAGLIKWLNHNLSTDNG